MWPLRPVVAGRRSAADPGSISSARAFPVRNYLRHEYDWQADSAAVHVWDVVQRTLTRCREPQISIEAIGRVGADGQKHGVIERVEELPAKLQRGALANTEVLEQGRIQVLQARSDQHVAAALELFAAVALLFWYIVQILALRRND